jgi:hypothetical protein
MTISNAKVLRKSSGVLRHQRIKDLIQIYNCSILLTSTGLLTKLVNKITYKT